MRTEHSANHKPQTKRWQHLPIRHSRQVVKALAVASALCVWGSAAQAQLTINANFTSTLNASAFGAGTTPIADLANAATVEATIDQAISQVTSLVQTPLTLSINFLNTTSGLGASLDTGHIDLAYSTYLADLTGATF